MLLGSLTSRLARAGLLVLALALVSAASALAQSPSPSVPARRSRRPAELRLIDQRDALLGGNVRPGAWTAVDVSSTNNGPAVNGELRIRGQQADRIAVRRRGAAADRRRPALHALRPDRALRQPHLRRPRQRRPDRSPRSRSTIQVARRVQPIVAVVAERPEGVLPQVTDAMVNPNVADADGHPARPRPTCRRASRPGRPSTASSGRTSTRRSSPRRSSRPSAVVGAGGRLIILGGTTGAGTLRGFGDGPAALRPAAHRRRRARRPRLRCSGRLPSAAATRSGRRRHARPRHRARAQRRRRHRRRGRLRPRHRHAGRLRPGRALARRQQRRRRPVAPPAAARRPARRSTRCRLPTTRRSSTRSRTCRRSTCRRSSSCSSCWSPTSP